MRLKDEEKDMIKDWWDTDMNIEVDRSDYTAILESNVYYSHYPDGSAERKKGDKRGLYVYTNSQKHKIIHPDSEDAFKSAKEAINYLKDKGDLRKLNEVA